MKTRPRLFIVGVFVPIANISLEVNVCHVLQTVRLVSTKQINALLVNKTKFISLVHVELVRISLLHAFNATKLSA